ncbi:MAG: hypothetical protein IJQ81_09425 [Oscillibacter sp.]|nr:hypothetical protein [Oscillibacter sp.]
MNEQKRAELDFRQNVVITLLSMLAVALFARTELFHLGWEMLSSDFAVTEPSAQEQQETTANALTLPVRVAATGVYGGVYGRYVIVNMTTGSRSFRTVRGLFASALREARPFERMSEAAFLDALRGASLYLDFLTPLPLSVLSGLTGAALSDERDTRSVALARTPDGVKLCLWDGADTYSCRTAAVSWRELEDIVSRYELGNGFFASDLYDVEDDYRTVAPLSLFPEQLPELPVYVSSSNLPDADQLLSAFRFNPLTKSRYTEASGTEVIMEGGRSIRIRPNGNVYYQDSGRGDLTIESAEERPTGWEAVTECAALLNQILVPQGFASVSPLEVRRDNRLLTLRFGYALDSVPVFHADGGPAATVTLDQRKVISVELRPRRYTVSNTDSLLLPLPQTLGVAGLHPGAELCLGYYDTGGSRLNAQWVSLVSAAPD